ncbi:exodeoxyribonuclease V subunit gamma [Acinetobacter sp. ANC 4973]|uniref:exodeoxyribonuclease V subunit gamma n=1 Tax=Acinetobacter sp. ANC 4973 TaxID=1977871 RepID=UPI000A3466F4|nr:exodeoxyribonuclease V subunit gamma [Acinetobacter sp. ANC 4973]OTH00401.1 exonuclease V subunit gamma [Acinetobacter sp. ANC 4973]
MAIHVIQSQRIDVLVHAMLTTVNKPAATPFQVLKTQHFIVPSHAVEAWLTQKLAEQKGISANTQFHHRIRGFQWSAYQWVLVEQKEQVRKANIPRIIIKWRIFQALKTFIQAQQNPLTPDHPLYSIVQRIYDSADRLEQGVEKQLKKQGMLYWVAEQVSRLFSHYMEYRGHCQKNCPANLCNCPSNWLQAWGQNKQLPIEQMFFKTNTEISAFTLNQAHELEAWQRWLWQEVFHQDFEQMQSIDAMFWEILDHPETRQAALKKLPSQLVIFTLLDLPPMQLAFLRRLGQYIDIYILHYNPSQEYWADSVDPNWKARYDVGVKERFIAKNPQASDADITKFFQEFTLNFNAEQRESRHLLLTRFGKQARDHFSLLSNLSSGEDGIWADAFVDDYANHLLAKVQSDVLYLVEPEQQQYVLDEQDDSIQIHVCHSSLRQLEVLKEQLIHWLAQGSKDEPRRPSDILVLSPSLSELEPLIRSVFAPPPSERDLIQQKTGSSHQLSRDSVYLPIKIAGVTQLDALNAWTAVLGRIELIQRRFSIEDFADWLSLSATQQLYGLEVNAIERITELLIDAGFKRGLDAQHLQRSLSAGDDDYRFSFKFALDRLALGIAIPEHTLFQGTLSFAKVLPSDFELIAKLIQIYQDFDARRDWMTAHEQGESVPVETWLKRLMQDITEFEDAGVESLSSVYKIIKKQERMLTLASFYDEHDHHALRALSLPLPYLLAEINSTLETQLEHAEPTGQITFSQIGQIRPVPYKLIVMLGLDSGKFPNRSQHLPFDLMDLLKPQLGDRSRLEDDQGAFLDNLLLAQESLWLFYNGFDINDGEVRDPSTVLQELIQHLAFIVQSKQPDAAVNETVNIHGVDVAEQLQSLYHVHPLLPFDPVGFESVKPVRYQDQWFSVAGQIRHATGQRAAWVNTPYQHLQQDVQVLDSHQWIQDVTFPARLYLKTLGVDNLRPEDLPAVQEPLLLDGLGRYAVRHFLQQHEGEAKPELLMDQLPIGKLQHSSWHMSVLEQQRLQDRLLNYASETTPTTQQVWKINDQIYMNIRLPKNSAEQWVSLEDSSARAKRRAKVWLEYLLWLAYLNMGEGGEKLTRIVVFSDRTILCQGVSSNQAREWISHWLAAWKYGQTQPLVLPAALLLKIAEKDKVHDWQANEQNQMCIEDMEVIYKDWHEDGKFTGFSVADNEATKMHRDWQFILQEQDATALLEQACKQFSYQLYQPVFWHQSVIEE